jgi:glycosyltransferase involved in cell wall biosynthesis
VNVLYVSHTSRMSGAERSLLDLLAGFSGEVLPVVACPEGALAAALRGRQVPVGRLPEVRASLRLHPYHSAIGMLDIVIGAVATRRLASRMRAQLLHANTIRAGLIATLATRFGGPPTIVHAHDCLPATRIARQTRRVLWNGAAAIFANSRHTATNFATGYRGAVHIVYNAVDLDRFDPSQITRIEARHRLGLDERAPVLGVVGQISPWKGQEDAIHAFAQVHASHPQARLLLVGSALFAGNPTRYDVDTYRTSLERTVEQLGLIGAVRFLGQREDLPQILRALDLLLLPSWEEPFGRVVIEAMAMEVAVVATNVGGPAEVITSGEDGLLLPPREPGRWAEAIVALLDEPELRGKMGRRARHRVATSFSRDRFVERVLCGYTQTLASGWSR